MSTYAHPMQRQVAAFHRAFDMPDGIEHPTPLAPERLALRLALVEEEGVAELQQACNEVRQDGAHPAEIIDAVVDTMYVSLGALVELGVDLQDVDLPDGPYVTDDLLDAAHLVAPHLEHLIDIARRGVPDILETQQLLFSTTFHLANLILRIADIDPEPFVREIQRANMSKLGSDGKPIHSRGFEIDGFPEGKVLKGPHYEPPNLVKIFDRFYPQED